MTIDPDSGQVLLAIHDGLYNVSTTPARKIGPTIELMGFTTAGPGHYYASGHPGRGTDLPNPVGLIESVDGGVSWRPLSRQGESDFHALAAFHNGFAGFDDRLRTSTDGETWQTSTTTIQPVNLSSSPDGISILGTTEQGLRRSTDGGQTCAAASGAPLLLFIAYASTTTVAGVSPTGVILLSTDDGLTWTSTGSVNSGPAAITAATGSDGTMTIWVATTDGVAVSTDRGNTFSIL